MRSALATAVVALALSACGPRIVAVPHSVPAATQLDLVRLPRVWVAGFIASREPRFDLNAETVRLLRERLRATTTGGVVDANPLSLTSEAVFSDRAYWQRLGEEHGDPLIVTGSVQLLVAPPVPVYRGRRATYLHGSGRVLKANAVLIDGRTGTVVATQELPQRMRYDDHPISSGAGLYYDLMEQALTDWLVAIGGAGRTP